MKTSNNAHAKFITNASLLVIGDALQMLRFLNVKYAKSFHANGMKITFFTLSIMIHSQLSIKLKKQQGRCNNGIKKKRYLPSITDTSKNQGTVQ